MPNPLRMSHLQTGDRIYLQQKSGEQEAFIFFDKIEVSGSTYFILKQEIDRERYYILRLKENALVSCESEEEMDMIINLYLANLEQKKVEG